MAVPVHRTFTAAFKLEVIEYAEKHGNPAAGSHYGISRNTPRSWRKQRESLLKMNPGRRQAPRRGDPDWPELEVALEDWIFEQVVQDKHPTTTQICSKAQDLARSKNLDNFQVSPRWCKRFLKYHRPSIFARLSTGLADGFLGNRLSSEPMESRSKLKLSSVEDQTGTAGEYEPGLSTFKLGFPSVSLASIIHQAYGNNCNNDNYSSFCAGAENKAQEQSPPECRYCCNHTAWQNVLTDHDLVHRALKPYKCSICGKRYASKDTLSEHKWIHSKEKRFKCTMCDKAFVWRTAFNTHKETHNEQSIGAANGAFNSSISEKSIL